MTRHGFAHDSDTNEADFCHFPSSSLQASRDPDD
jgi:hypothetical protein